MNMNLKYLLFAVILTAFVSVSVAQDSASARVEPVSIGKDLIIGRSGTIIAANAPVYPKPEGDWKIEKISFDPKTKETIYRAALSASTGRIKFVVSGDTRALVVLTIYAKADGINADESRALKLGTKELEFDTVSIQYREYGEELDIVAWKKLVESLSPQVEIMSWSGW